MPLNSRYHILMTKVLPITIKYTQAHQADGLIVPDSKMLHPILAKVISDAVIHAEAHPRYRYAAALMRADHEFAESLA